MAEKAVAPKVAAVKVPAATPPARQQLVAAKPPRPAPKTAREQAVASLDRSLLRDSSFGDLMKGVRAEARRAR